MIIKRRTPPPPPLVKASKGIQSLRKELKEMASHVAKDHEKKSGE
jgi:succinate dehydrogenase / fumarate reductase iron-sulfur subunit